MKLSPTSYKDLKSNIKNHCYGFLVQTLPISDLLLSNPGVYRDLDLSGGLSGDTQARVLLLQDPLSGSYGGCVLRLSAREVNCPKLENTIYASHTFFQLDEESGVHEEQAEFEQLMADFYSELLVAKLRYGLERGCNILTIQTVEEHHDSKLFGNWQFKDSYIVNETQVISHLGSAFEQLQSRKAAA